MSDREQVVKTQLIYLTTIPATLNVLVRGEMVFMKNKGFQVEAVSSPGVHLNELAVEEEIPIHEVNIARRISPLKDLLALIRLWLLFLKLRPTIVHGSTAKAGLISMLAGTLAGVDIRVYTLRGLMTEIHSGFAGKILKVTEWIACHCAHQVFAVSRSVEDAVTGEKLCATERIKVLHKGSGQGVDARNTFNPTNHPQEQRKDLRGQYGIPSNARVVGFVGRLVEDKGISELWQAWQTIRSNYEDVRLMMIGSEEPGDPVAADMVEELRADPHVIMIDFVPRRQMARHYAVMDLVVLPSHREGFPNVALEAAAMELAVIATQVTGCRDAIKDGVTGTLTRPRDPSALAEAIGRYLDDKELRLDHGKKGREWVVRDFQQEIIWDARYREYVRLMVERGLPIPQPVSLEESGTAVSDTAESLS
jgi:glycosyltransferase involved in cell wall biosynthesis